MEEAGLRLHPGKTKIVYCKDRKRRLDYPCTSFTFLGYTFRARKAPARDGKSMFTAFLPAISGDALKNKGHVVRRWRINLRTTPDLAELAEWMNPVIRGSPGVLSPSHDVAPEAPRRASATHLQGRGARCRCWSHARRLGTRPLVQHLWRDYPVLINL
jgi:hypothetical protein